MNRYNNKLDKLYVYLITIMILLSLSDCIEKKDNNKNFNNLEQGISYTANIQNMTLFIANNIDQTTSFTEDTNIASLVKDIDFNNNIVVAIFRGRMSNSGYGIIIKDIESSSGIIKIRVKLTDPDPGQLTSTVISYPYHIILLPKDKFQIYPGIIWQVYDLNNTLLYQIKK